MTKLAALLLLFLPTVSFSQDFTPRQVSFRPDTFNILDFGAVGDGLQKNTDAINKAIASCAESGGGTVLIPAGFWLTGPIQLRSNVNLHNAKNSVVQFTGDLSDYPLIKTNWEGVDAYRCHSPIYGVDVENIAITGSGIFDGAGAAWRPVKKNKMTPPEWEQLVESGGFLNENKDIWYPTESSREGSRIKRPGVIAEGFDLAKSQEIKDFLRPNMLNLVRCKRILLDGVTFQNSPAWCLHPIMSQDITMRDLTVRNPWNAQNGDGVDLESCRFVLIENCTFDVGDDGICLKSGRDEEGRKRGMPTEDVIIRGCTVFHGHGGFVVGSEMSGGVRNILVSDCNFMGTDIGLRFKTMRGRGGVVENIFVRNIRMNNIGGAAILFDMYYMAKDPLAVFSGSDNPPMEFKAITEETPRFRKIKIENVVCHGAETAIFIRGLPEMNISGIILENIAISSKAGFVCIEGQDITLKNATFVRESGPVISIGNSKAITFDNIQYVGEGRMLNVQGERSKDIKLLNCGPLAKDAVLLGPEVPEKIIKRN